MATTNIGPCACCGGYDCCQCANCCFSTTTKATVALSIISRSAETGSPVSGTWNQTIFGDTFVDCVAYGVVGAVAGLLADLLTCEGGIAWRSDEAFTSCYEPDADYTYELRCRLDVSCSGGGFGFVISAQSVPGSIFDPILTVTIAPVLTQTSGDQDCCGVSNFQVTLGISIGGGTAYYDVSGSLIISNNKCCGTYDLGSGLLLSCNKQTGGCDGKCPEENPLL